MKKVNKKSTRLSTSRKSKGTPKRNRVRDRRSNKLTEKKKSAPQLQEVIEEEIDKLLQDGHIKRFEEW